MPDGDEIIEERLEKIEREINEIKKNINSSDRKKKFLKSAGSWSTVDTDKIKKNLYESRSAVSRKKVEF